LKHASQVSSCWPYAHDKFEDEVFTENAQDWDEVVARMVDPKMTRFKSMSLDEQETILEQSAQGALRAREEMIVVEAAVPQVAAETTEIPQVTPVQDRGLPEAQDAWERGLLMLEHVQWIIDQLQDDPDIINMTRLPADNPDESQTGPSGPEFIDLDEITGLDDPEFTTPLAGSPTGVSAQPETVRTSGRTSVSNPLSELIKIYDDDESPEVSLVTPVHIEEEKGPEKTSSPVPDAQIQGFHRKNKKSRVS
jgi:hypothetical protein